MSASLLQIRGLEKRYGDLTAVDGISFTIEPGEIFALLGPNGAGKTTTVMMIAGQIAADSGDILLAGGGTPDQASGRRVLGVAPQNIALYDDLTGDENLRFFGRMQGLTGNVLHEAMERVREITGLGRRLQERVKTYSGGMQRRLNLAAALIHQPCLLLLDEPTVGVDPQSRNALLDRIRSLGGEGIGVLYTTHYMDEVERIADRVGIMDHGRLLALDSVARLIREHGGPSTVEYRQAGQRHRIQTSSPLRVARELPREGVQDFAIHRPTLEAVFLNLTGRALRD